MFLFCIYICFCFVLFCFSYVLCILKCRRGCCLRQMRFRKSQPPHPNGHQYCMLHLRCLPKINYLHLISYSQKHSLFLTSLKSKQITNLTILISLNKEDILYYYYISYFYFIYYYLFYNTNLFIYIIFFYFIFYYIIMFI